MTEFYVSLLHPLGANATHYTNVKLFTRFSFDTEMAEAPCQTDIIYENKLVKYLN